MIVLLVEKPNDRGGHELATKMKQLPCVRRLYIAGQDESVRELGFYIYADYADAQDIDKLIYVARLEEIKVVVIEPENPVANTILDACKTHGLTAFVGLCDALPLLNSPDDLSS